MKVYIGMNEAIVSSLDLPAVSFLNFLAGVCLLYGQRKQSPVMFSHVLYTYEGWVGWKGQQGDWSGDEDTAREGAYAPDLFRRWHAVIFITLHTCMY